MKLAITFQGYRLTGEYITKSPIQNIMLYAETISRIEAEQDDTLRVTQFDGTQFIAVYNLIQFANID